jgi:hypothetical protein
MFLKNFFLISNASRLSRWSAIAHNIKRYSHRYRRASSFGSSHSNNSVFSFKCGDVEKGIKQQYIQSKAYNNNENEVKTCSRNELLNIGSNSDESVNSRRGLKIVGSLFVIIVASGIAYYMDNFYYSLIPIFVAFVTLLFITGIWRWFYIAAVTGPRDLM